MNKYSPKKVETKWQKYWREKKLYKAKDNSDKPKYYCLVEFPYPSGDGLHVGHTRSYTAMDVLARKRKMEGYNVLYPMGWDAFGLPTENFAIKTKTHPKDVTKKNTDNFRRQLKSLGYSFDWDREINTTDPKYYKWTQWIFLQLYKNGLAYKHKMPINWCLSCRVGLANEEVIDGRCERCGGATEKREKEQWMLAITKYADRLDKDLDKVDFLEKIKTQQRNWIGKSTGTEIDFQIKNSQEKLKVFTTRVDTIFGCTYVVVAPEHQIISNLKPCLPAGRSQISNLNEVENYIEQSKKKSELQRTELEKDKTGVEMRGIKAINPFNNEEVPVFVADYVLGHYGTGAVMAVPAHDERDWEFAKKYGLKIKKTIVKNFDFLKEEFVFFDDGVLVDSGQFSKLTSQKAREEMAKWLVKNKKGKITTQFKLRDWIFSRQHYWGEPIPIVICPKCGLVPLPEKSLPLELPNVKKYEPTNTGESPLAAITKWVNTKCPKCKSPAKRETDTMPNWAGSSWYFLRYIDSKNNKTLASKNKLKYWMPVDWYNGGMEHTTLHLLYSRFWNKFLYDIKMVPFSEPYKKRTSHGMILGEDGEKMSKSRGNVVNPDDMIKNFGADEYRLYQMFMGPFDQAIPWDSRGIIGVERFLHRVWGITKVVNEHSSKKTDSQIDILLEKTIKKVSEDIESFSFNTAISQMMIFINKLGENTIITKADFKKFLILLSPFAPHLSEELWSQLGNKKSIFLTSWPKYDLNKIREETFNLVIQVNGKVRDSFEIKRGISQKDAEALTLERINVKKWISGEKVKKIIFIKDKLINIVI